VPRFALLLFSFNNILNDLGNSVDVGQLPGNSTLGKRLKIYKMGFGYVGQLGVAFKRILE